METTLEQQLDALTLAQIVAIDEAVWADFDLTTGPSCSGILVRAQMRIAETLTIDYDEFIRRCAWLERNPDQSRLRTSVRIAFEAALTAEYVAHLLNPEDLERLTRAWTAGQETGLRVPEAKGIGDV